eukprot:CAMPEP_0177654986 /NCGR_PEP_ID=MMETSP0447-20121125/14679_1 /TAXON_ID=0 /ORGANISM="Stygamoeba regulata, Strain BSH-02190019" /LENGTH=104 /DNA_ID=CAMNT_0019158781 /DNA_START=56 /DNA_END=370 /DNA_ORIENTATION=+
MNRLTATTLRASALVARPATRNPYLRARARNYSNGAGEAEFLKERIAFLENEISNFGARQANKDAEWNQFLIKVFGLCMGLNVTLLIPETYVWKQVAKMTGMEE